jgi:uncharacterized protein YlxP (DUF503 family)
VNPDKIPFLFLRFNEEFTPKAVKFPMGIFLNGDFWDTLWIKFISFYIIVKKEQHVVVSILQLIIELPESSSLKDKRREIKSLKDKLRNRFKLSIAEVALNDSIRFAHLGAALVSNSKSFGESVLQKAMEFAERNVYGRLVDVKVFSEQY